MVDDDEMREILGSIARDPDAYPRDRIAAIKALRELGFEGPVVRDDIYPPDELGRKRASRERH
jgi:hypothetical protein